MDCGAAARLLRVMSRVKSHLKEEPIAADVSCSANHGHECDDDVDHDDDSVVVAFWRLKAGLTVTGLSYPVFFFLSPVAQI